MLFCLEAAFASGETSLCFIGWASSGRELSGWGPVPFTFLIFWCKTNIYILHNISGVNLAWYFFILTAERHFFSFKSASTNLVHYTDCLHFRRFQTFLVFLCHFIDACAASKLLKVKSKWLFLLEINIQTNKQTNHICASPKKLEMVDFISPHKNFMILNNLHPL